VQEDEEAKQEEDERESVKAPGQVVDLPPPPVPSDRPRDAKFVAEHDVKVDREMKRQGRFDDKPATPPLLAMRTPTSKAAAPGGPSAPPGQAGRARKPSAESPPAPEAPEPVPQDPDGAHALAPGVPRSSKDDPAMGSPDKHPPGSMPLVPNSMQLARAIGAGTQDHLPEVDDGPTTALNAKGWKFASFFNRIKRQVAQHWRPADQYEKRDPTGNIYGSGQWVTFLRVVLKPDGTLSGVAVDKPSGLEFLDDEAVEAIKRGSPYPNPPSQLIGEGGLIAFKFGFFFDVDGGPRMKVYRYSGL
jgi:TonB family protein